MKNNALFSNPALVRELVGRICAAASSPLNIMEFCGTHSHALYRYGFRQLMPETITLLSGPGCPICVTPTADIDRILALASISGVTVATFGDLLKVPGSRGSLLAARTKGADIHTVYSPLDAVDLAARNPRRKIVFPGIGFETTAPAVAASILYAKESRVSNYSVFSAHKVTPPAMRAILDMGEVALGGVLCPGHVSMITGWEAWEFVPRQYAIPAVAAGFEPTDILIAIEELVRQHETGVSEAKNMYPRCVTAGGNAAATAIMNEVFEISDAEWRGLGIIPSSGLVIKEAYRSFDAGSIFGLKPEACEEPAGCLCGEIIRGVMRPHDCPLFAGACTPENPLGPCMVSSEGNCAACYRYG